MFNYLEPYEELWQDTINQYDVLIKEVEDVTLPLADLFDLYDLPKDKIIRLIDHAVGSTTESYTSREGVTIFYEQDDTQKAVIFLPAVIWNEEDLNNLSKYLVLIHEVYHVKDFFNQINIKFNKGVTDSIKAEIYAHTSVIKYFTQRGHKADIQARALYVTALLQSHKDSDNPIKREIFTGVLRKYTVKKLQQWEKQLDLI